MAAADPRCPLCCRPVTAGASALVEHGEPIHVECHLGLLDAGAAVARLLRQRPGHPLCATCIAHALGLTVGEAQAGSARLRALRGFEIRFDQCVGCNTRSQVVRAIRGPGQIRDARTA
jgi:hypothetical protein